MPRADTLDLLLKMDLRYADIKIGRPRLPSTILIAEGVAMLNNKAGMTGLLL
jgi:hypothetical protein